MKQVLIAAFITLFLLVGGVALTFAFQAPEDNPRVFSLEDARQEELAYRAETVRSAEELISGGITLLMANAPREEQAAVRPVLVTVRANLAKLGQIDLGMDPATTSEGAEQNGTAFSVREENNRLVDESVNALRAINAPSMQEAIYRLADHIDLRLRVRWEPDMEKVDVGWEVYQQNCSTCHGAYGDGEQITPEGLSVFPRDFTGKSHRSRSVVFKFNTSDRPDMLALDEDLRKTIREGLPGTPMPGFSDFSDEEVDAVIEFIKTFGYSAWKFNHPSGPGIIVPEMPADFDSPESVETGRELFNSRGCLACHGDVENGGPPLANQVTDWMKDGELIPIVPRDYAHEPIRRPAIDDMFKTIRLGVKGTPMLANNISDDDTWDLIAYILYVKQLGIEGKVKLQERPVQAEETPAPAH